MSGAELRPLVFSLLELLVNFLLSARVERSLSNGKRVSDDTNRPEIHLLVVSLALLKNFWRKVVGCAAHRCSSLDFHFLLGDQQSRQAKVADLDVHVRIQEEIASLQIAVYNMSCVQVLYGAADLNHKASDLGECEAFPLLQHVGQ